MRTPTILIATLLVVFCGTLALAQDEPKPADEPEKPTTEPEALPALPKPPYVQEDVEPLNKHIAANREELQAAQSSLIDAENAAEEEGLTEEVKATRDKQVADLKTRIATLESDIQTLESAVTVAATGPTRDQLKLRQEYDAAYNLAAQARKDLRVRADGEQSAEIMPEGDYAKRVREAEEEQRRIGDLSVKAENFDFSKSRVYEKLSDLEKLDYERRWASNRLQLSIDAYDHLGAVVFKAYRAYEQRAIDGLNAVVKAKELWPKIEGTPAEKLELPEPAKAPSANGNGLDALRSSMSDLYRARWPGRSTTGPLSLKDWENRLRAIQQEIDVREDYLDRLERDAEQLKDILASAENGNGAQSEAPEGVTPVTEPAEYQKLGEEIDGLEQDLIDNRAEIEDLQNERAILVESHTKKQGVEVEVEARVARTEQLIAAIEWKYLPESKRPEDTDSPVMPADSDVSLPEFRYRAAGAAFNSPVILLFTLREELKAQKERFSNAKRDTRQAQTQIEINDRRVERLNERNVEIENELLPEKREQYYEEIGKTVGIRAGKVMLVIFAAWLLLLLIRKLGEPMIEKIVSKADKTKSFSADEQQRVRTLMTVFMTTARLVVYITAIMFAIAQFDVDYGPLLVAAGGVSLAVGFGAQTLVKDFFAGFFILLEGQYSIGDVVEVGGKIGTVEHIGLRTTVLRSLSGDVHTIPNGEISSTTNMTKIWSRAVVDVGVAYEENVDEIGQVIQAVAQELRNDAVWGEKILDSIYMGVQSLGDSSVNLRILLKTRAGEQWGASREFNRRCKLKFDELGIEIPWPQHVVSYKDYTDKTDDDIKSEARKKRAQMLRYVRKMHGEADPEDAALAAMSVEERDRAETLANHEAELANDKSEMATEDSPGEVAEERAEEVEDDENVSAAEKWAKQQATQKLEKDAVDERRKQIPRDADEAEDAPGSGDSDEGDDK